MAENVEQAVVTAGSLKDPIGIAATTCSPSTVRLPAAALDVVETQGRGKDRPLQLVRDYETDNVSEKVLRIILSYSGFVNRKVWRKV